MRDNIRSWDFSKNRKDDEILTDEDWNQVHLSEIKGENDIPEWLDGEEGDENEIASIVNSILDEWISEFIKNRSEFFPWTKMKKDTSELWLEIFDSVRLAYSVLRQSEEDLDIDLEKKLGEWYIKWLIKRELYWYKDRVVDVLNEKNPGNL